MKDYFTTLILLKNKREFCYEGSLLFLFFSLIIKKSRNILYYYFLNWNMEYEMVAFHWIKMEEYVGAT